MSQTTVRELLLGIGMGDFNAGSAIRYMFMAVSTTDPAMPPIILLVKHIQETLVAMGASDVQVNGRIDNATADAIQKISGADWLSQPWWQIVTDILKAKKRGFVFVNDASYGGNTPPVPMSGILDSIPGGAMGAAIGAAAIWYFLVKKKAS